MSIRLEFDLTFRSDFHIGAGHGLGILVDSALLRDSDGIPVIRGTTIAGMLRESLMNLIGLDVFRDRYQRCHASGKPQNGDYTHEYCGQFMPTDTDCPVCAIFGSPRHARPWHISSARPVELLSPQQPDTWQAGQTAAEIIHRVRVNPYTRRTENQKLFTREEGSSSLDFRFHIETFQQDDQAWEQAIWLVAAARLVRHVGASKSRGQGECAIRLSDRDKEHELLAGFEKRARGQAVYYAVQDTKSGIEAPLLPVDIDKHTYRIRVLLRTNEPLLIARRAEAGNQFETIENIPGSVMRGALAWRAAHHQQLAQKSTSSSEYKTFVQLFFRGALHCSSLLLVQVTSTTSHSGYPCIPAPRDLRTCELHPGYKNGSTDAQHGVWSLAWDDQLLDQEQCPVCKQNNSDTRLASLDGFLPLNRANLTTGIKPEQTAEMHIRMEAQTGRVRTGDLYGYVSLDSGQYFVGDITCPTRHIWETICSLADLAPFTTPNELRLGKAARRGYGSVSIVFEAADKPPWQGPDLEQRLTTPEKVVMTLISDTIVLDTWGRCVCGFDQDWLTRELNLPTGTVIKIDLHRQYSAVRTIDSFNGTLGLPRNRDIALVAGSSVRLHIRGIELKELQAGLRRVEQCGIGVRREEGFGCIVFNHPVYTHCTTWQEPSLTLDALNRGKEVHQYEDAKVDLFVRDWRKELDRTCWKWNGFAPLPFESVARLLHTTTHTTLDSIRDMLHYLGNPAELLPSDVYEQIRYTRDQRNFFATDGKRALDMLQQQRIEDPESGKLCQTSLLAELDTMVQKYADTLEQQQRFWPIGLRMLADRIAQVVHQKTQQTEGKS